MGRAPQSLQSVPRAQPPPASSQTPFSAVGQLSRQTGAARGPQSAQSSPQPHGPPAPRSSQVPLPAVAQRSAHNGGSSSAGPRTMQCSLPPDGTKSWQKRSRPAGQATSKTSPAFVPCALRRARTTVGASEKYTQSPTTPSE